MIRGDFQVLTQNIEGFVVDDFTHVPGSAVRTKAIRGVSKHHGHTKKTTRARDRHLLCPIHVSNS